MQILVFEKQAVRFPCKYWCLRMQIRPPASQPGVWRTKHVISLDVFSTFFTTPRTECYFSERFSIFAGTTNVPRKFRNCDRGDHFLQKWWFRLMFFRVFWGRLGRNATFRSNFQLLQGPIIYRGNSATAIGVIIFYKSDDFAWRFFDFFQTLRAESKFWGDISLYHGPKQTRWRRSLRGDAFEPTRHRRHVGAACQASQVIKPAVQQGRRRQPAGSQQGLSRGRRMCLDFSEMSRAFSRIKFPFQMSRKCNFWAVHGGDLYRWRSHTLHFLRIHKDRS